MKAWEASLDCIDGVALIAGLTSAATGREGLSDKRLGVKLEVFEEYLSRDLSRED